MNQVSIFYFQRHLGKRTVGTMWRGGQLFVNEPAQRESVVTATSLVMLALKPAGVAHRSSVGIVPKA